MAEVLSCLPCCKAMQGKNKDCIEEALQKIKQHYLFFSKESEKKQKQIESLKEKNSELERAIQRMQEDRRSLQSEAKIANDAAIEINGDDDVKSHISDEISFNSNEASPIAPSDLNIAINSENMLDASALSYTSTQNETIGETESLGYSPQKLKVTHSVWQKRRQQMRSNSKKANFENLLDINANNGTPNKAEVRPCTSTEIANETVGKQNTATLRDLINMKNDKKINLSLNSNKVRQKRLTFEREKTGTKDKKNLHKEKLEEVIESPMVTDKTKPVRNLLARKDSIRNKSLTLSQEMKSQMTQNLATSTSKKDAGNTDDYLFEFNTTVSPLKEKSNNIPYADTSLALKLSLSNKSDNSPSCVILTPATQDIVFIDDETDEDLGDVSKDIKTMDLMADILKTDNNTLTNLKRLELDCIKNQQKRAKDQVDGQSKKQTNEANQLKKIKLENSTQLSVAKPEAENDDVTFIDEEAVLAQPIPFLSKAMKRDLSASTEEDDNHNDTDLVKRIAKKAIKQNPNDSTVAGKQASDDAMDSEDDDLFKMPLPIVVKQEKDSSRDVSLKTRFAIDCPDCEQYLDLVGDRLTDREIENILEKCNHRRNLMDNCTPDGFWNPLLVSFADDDPRNEVLTHKPFLQNKRNLINKHTNNQKTTTSNTK